MSRRDALVIGVAVTALVLSAAGLGWELVLSARLNDLRGAQQDMEASLATIRHRCNSLDRQSTETKPPEKGKAGLAAQLEALKKQIEEIGKRASARVPRPLILPPSGLVLEHLGEIGKVRAEVARKVMKMKRSGRIAEGEYRKRMIGLTDLYRDAHAALSELQQKIAGGGVPEAEAKKQAAAIAERYIALMKPLAVEPKEERPARDEKF